MKKHSTFAATFALFTAAFAPSLFAQLSIPSDGSDGALNVTSNIVIDLSKSATGTWTTTSSGNGIYDPIQWAVVFKYSSVNITNGATVTFANHYGNPPVVWLVQSNVTINGTLSLNGNPGTAVVPFDALAAIPGPGGFRGGAYDSTIGQGDGFGPGGGADGGGQNNNGKYQSAYGNPQMLPLIGGSGASWTASCQNGSGPSGAGAILIAASGTVTVNGQVSAAGGYAATNECNGNYGAGGGIRIVGTQILGFGSINAGPDGRIRTEANSISPQLTITPNIDLVAPASPPVIFPPAGSPSVNIVSVAGLAAPADPQANVTSSPDIGLQTNGPVTVVLQTQNFPPSGTVALRVVPTYSASWITNATFVSGNNTSATWQLTAQIPLGFCVLQAHATSQ
jgi:hypothetical protein